MAVPGIELINRLLKYEIYFYIFVSIAMIATIGMLYQVVSAR